MTAVNTAGFSLYQELAANLNVQLRPKHHLIGTQKSSGARVCAIKPNENTHIAQGAFKRSETLGALQVGTYWR